MRTAVAATVLVLLVLALVVATDAQEARAVFTQLLSAKSLRCELGAGTQASWDGGSLKLERSNFGSGATVTFDSIDTKAGKARIIGNTGAGDVSLLVTPSGLTFVEQTAFGNLNFTTVFGRYASAASRRFVVVSSRHHDLNGPFPSQFHGTCSILE